MWCDSLVFSTHFVMLTLLGCVFSFLTRDYFLRRVLRWECQGVRFTDFNYSLLGLRIDDGKVTCPECGEVRDFEAMGLTAQDLLAESGEC